MSFEILVYVSPTAAVSVNPASFWNPFDCLWTSFGVPFDGLLSLLTPFESQRRART